MANDLSSPVPQKTGSPLSCAPPSLRIEIRLLALLVATAGAFVLILGLGVITLEGFHLFSEQFHLPAESLLSENNAMGFGNMMIFTAGGCFATLGFVLMLFALLMPRLYR